MKTGKRRKGMTEEKEKEAERKHGKVQVVDRYRNVKNFKLNSPLWASLNICCYLLSFELNKPAYCTLTVADVATH